MCYLARQLRHCIPPNRGMPSTISREAYNLAFSVAFFITSVMAEAQKRFRYNWAWKKTKGGFGHYRLGVLRCAYSFLDFCFFIFSFFLSLAEHPSRDMSPAKTWAFARSPVHTGSRVDVLCTIGHACIHIIQGQRRRNAKKRHGTGHVGDAARTQDTPPFFGICRLYNSFPADANQDLYKQSWA
mgnify:CR=1 FL=1